MSLEDNLYVIYGEGFRPIQIKGFSNKNKLLENLKKKGFNPKYSQLKWFIFIFYFLLLERKGVGDDEDQDEVLEDEREEREDEGVPSSEKINHNITSTATKIIAPKNHNILFDFLQSQFAFPQEQFPPDDEDDDDDGDDDGDAEGDGEADGDGRVVSTKGSTHLEEGLEVMLISPFLFFKNILLYTIL